MNPDPVAVLMSTWDAACLGGVEPLDFTEEAS